MLHLRRRKSSVVAVLGVFTSAFLFLPAAPAQTGPDSSGKSIGIVASKDASAKDIGLPIYPGAKLAQKDGDGDPTAQIGLWAGGSGFKLVIMKLESSDSADKIASFYRNALGKYGKVLDCTGVKSKDEDNQGSKSSALTCDDSSDDSGIVLKSGTRERQHIVGIEDKQGKRLIHLVYLLSQDEDKKI